MGSLGIEMISVMGMPPVQFIELAAKIGCSHISMGLNQMEFNPFNFPRYSLLTDAHLRNEVKAALKANDVDIALGENLPIIPDRTPLELWKQTLDILSDLGVQQINSVSFEIDQQRNVDQYGQLAELTTSYGIRTLIEFVPIFGVATMQEALEIIKQVNSSNLGLIFDTMHAGRTGVTKTELSAVAPEHIGYVQLCDALSPNGSYTFMDQGYMDEARYERLPPGGGELHLLEYLNALPEGVKLSLEVPQRCEALARIPLQETLEHSIAEAWKLINASTFKVT